MKVLVVGTRNAKKRQEIIAALAGWPVDVLDLGSFPQAPEVVEDRDTFEGNAAKKATELAMALGQWVLGEDSGLVVPALNGAPGVWSARYAGHGQDDAANNAKLMREMAGKADRRAHYVTVAAISNPAGEVVATVRGECHGAIVAEARGAGGFGYDPYFYLPEYHKTFGELSASVKQAISHRARALEKLKGLLPRIIGLPASRRETASSTAP
ncbi:MAG: RdgB/HAM1 family non-canonical purine NTP pyrophosphatase [Planctomycetes bacterium]|nr:RdgB/HAM1 family non-canonical purine NTP pyrophosphatase [Planctomycetota bacterium]